METSGKYGSVAILRKTDDGIVCETESLATDAGSAKNLAPAIDRLLARLAIDVRELSAIALLTGPGSFTGLRVGVATAKAMAYALKIPTIDIDTLDAIAMQIDSSNREIHVVLDAYRGQIFYSKYTQSVKNSATAVLDIEDWLAEILGGELGAASLQVCGPGCDRIRRYLADSENLDWQERVSDIGRIQWIDGPDAFPNAESVAKLGYAKFSAGVTLDPFHLLPHYYRGSAAEEVAAKSKRG